MTPPRQIWLFKVGCWVAFVTAGLHLAGHLLVVAAAPRTVSAALADPPGYLFRVPGQTVPSGDQVADGFSLSFSLLLATLAGAGVVVAKRSQTDPVLLRGVARAYGIGSSVLLVVSILMFFSVQSFAIAIMTLCFGLASVSET